MIISQKILDNWIETEGERLNEFFKTEILPVIQMMQGGPDNMSKDIFKKSKEVIIPFIERGKLITGDYQEACEKYGLYSKQEVKNYVSVFNELDSLFKYYINFYSKKFKKF